jgi:peptidoglycan/LPS O-acetylase OafA/YrhL
MRPVKQLGVVSTHSLQWFAPAANIGVGAGLMLTHVTRFAFMFISAGMLAYAYPMVARGGWRTFWRRRLLAVALPYVTWTVIYFALGIVQSGQAGGIDGDAGRLGSLLLTGYDQLYFLVVLMQFYLLYPAFLWLVRRTERASPCG